ncbi:MAG: ATP-binding protein [Ignavibacteriaceae bacterium]|jgi:anti-sigma regulatory factor (Ser/Thr protein kinase)|nr:ATP-binding protein [Ignavibacteriaceae bacterium]
MGSRLSITIRNDISEVSRLADIIELFGRTNKVAASSTFEINLVMDEVLANIIMHGFPDIDEHIIEIKISLNGETFSAEIVDDGIAFNPLKSTKDDRGASLEEKGIGGLGIHIIKKYMDKVAYKRVSNKNVLMIKKVVTIEQ